MEHFCMVLTILAFYMKLRPKMAQPSPDTVGGVTPTIVGDGGRKLWCLNDTNTFKVSPWRSTIVSFKKQEKRNEQAAAFQGWRCFTAETRDASCISIFSTRREIRHATFLS